jgi:hypothetical protein
VSANFFGNGTHSVHHASKTPCRGKDVSNTSGVVGFLGFSWSALRGPWVHRPPRLPKDWPSLTITGIRIGDAVIDITSSADGRVDANLRGRKQSGLARYSDGNGCWFHTETRRGSERKTEGMVEVDFQGGRRSSSAVRRSAGDIGSGPR